MTDYPDRLRTPKDIFDPDARSADFAVLGEDGYRPKTLQDQYDEVAPITLHEGVPREIVVKFDTARNLNLLSWFVYRVHSAARSHAYECLELALKMRFKEELLEREEKDRLARYEEHVKKHPKNNQPPRPIDREKYHPGMHELLEHAIAVGVLKNENFTAWQTKTELRARHRRDVEAIRRMQELGLTEVEVEEAQIEIKDEDRNHDYLGRVLESVPFIRNHYAHGTSALDNKSLSTLRLVAEIINQIFPRKSPRGAGVGLDAGKSRVTDN
jgi:hypothetical protein